MPIACLLLQICFENTEGTKSKKLKPFPKEFPNHPNKYNTQNILQQPIFIEN
jgi:hypothetical protein